METTEEAVPTITSPMTQSSATSISRRVEIVSCRPPMRTPAGAGAFVGDVRAGRRPFRTVVADVIAATPRGAGRGRALCTVRHPLHGSSLPHREAEVAEGRAPAAARHVNFATERKSP